MEIEIPDSFDPEWQAMMLRQLAGNIEALKNREDEPDELLIDCEEIIESLREYSGFSGRIVGLYFWHKQQRWI